MSISEDSYYLSSNVEIFPCAWRTTWTNGKFTSENNFTNIINALIDTKTLNSKYGSGSDGFVIYHDLGTANVGTLSVVIHGYYFEINNVPKATGDLWFLVRTSKNREVIMPQGDEPDYNKLDQSDDSGNLRFVALSHSIVEPATSANDKYNYYKLQVYANGVLNKVKFVTDSVKYSDNRTLTEELDMKQYRLTNGQGIETIENDSTGGNVVKIKDDEFAKLEGLASTANNSKRLTYFDTDGIATNSEANVGGWQKDDHTAFKNIYLENGILKEGPTITFSKNSPSGGSTGDIWFKYTD